jgi:hypothetical protein
MVPGECGGLHRAGCAEGICGGKGAMGGEGRILFLSGRGKKELGELTSLLNRLLLFPEAFEPVTDKGAHNKDDHVDDDDDENIKYPSETRAETEASKNKNPRYEHKGNSQNETGYRPVPEDAHEVFLPAMKKAKCNTDDEIQQVKPDIIVHEYQQYLVSYLKMFRKRDGFSDFVTFISLVRNPGYSLLERGISAG